MNESQRRWLYGIALAVIALLVGYNLISDDAAPLWIGLITALLAAAPVTALRNITPDEAVEDDES